MRSIVLAMTLALISSTAFSSERWVVAPKDAQCLLEYIDEYRKSSDDPVYIFLKACPTVDRKEAISKLQRNSGTGLRTQTNSDLDEVIFYTPEDLTCLLSSDFKITDKPVELPKDPCD